MLSSEGLWVVMNGREGFQGSSAVATYDLSKDNWDHHEPPQHLPLRLLITGLGKKRTLFPDRTILRIMNPTLLTRPDEDDPNTEATDLVLKVARSEVQRVGTTRQHAGPPKFLVSGRIRALTSYDQPVLTINAGSLDVPWLVR